jgi:hypothetical protein
METLILYYGGLTLIHLIMAIAGNIASIAWGAYGRWSKLNPEERSGWSIFKYLKINRARILFGVAFTAILMAVMPVVSIELFGEDHLSPLTALAFSIFPIPAMQLLMKKAESKINA